MLLQIPDVMTGEQVAEARRLLERAQWVGSDLATPHPPHLHNNLQLREGQPLSRELGELVMTALQRNPLFVAAALPLKVYPPLFNRYDRGQSFDQHVDNPIHRVRGTDAAIRTDLSATLFLTDPEEYDGGELIIEDSCGMHSVKLPSGHMVLYPASSLHNVTPVTRGSRIVSCFWLQSLVRDDGERALLFDLDTAIQRFTLELPDHPAAVQLRAVYHNLLRRWAHV